jgi:hypothetical protein
MGEGKGKEANPVEVPYLLVPPLPLIKCQEGKGK